MVEAVGGWYGCRQAGYWVFGLQFRSNFEWTYLVNRTVDFTRSFDTRLWFRRIRVDPEGNIEWGRLLVGRIGVDRQGIGCLGSKFDRNSNGGI